MFVEVDAPFSEVVRFFAEYRVHHLPVVEGPKVVGMLSSTDLLKLDLFLPTGGARPPESVDARLRITEVMRAPPVTIAGHETVEVAAALMARHGVHALPVTGPDDRLIGILTTSDLIEATLREAPAAVAPASRPGAASRSSIEALEMDQAVRAAKEFAEEDGQLGELARALLQSNVRVHALEAVVACADRYLRSGQNEHLHGELLRALERVRQDAWPGGRD